MKKINKLFKISLILFLLSFGLFLTSKSPRLFSAEPVNDKMPAPLPCYYPGTKQIVSYGGNCPADGAGCIPNPCDTTATN
jgi:hypothetical protein